MKATLDCLECVLRQGLKAARMATDDAAVQRRIVDEVAGRIPGLDLGESPAGISLCAYEIAAEISGNGDPYGALRWEQNAQVLALEAELRGLIEGSEDRLATALHLSAAGNIIDVGALNAEHIDVDGAIESALRERFAVDHTEYFRASLADASDLLFFLDNAGEIVFDKLLIEELQRYVRVTAVVKAGPIINDAVLEDAEQVGLTEVCEVIDNGGAFIGSPLSMIPDDFRQRMDRADVLVGKGQGNYETLDGYPGNMYLILRAKCDIVARHMGVEFGQVALISPGRRVSNSGSQEGAGSK